MWLVFEICINMWQSGLLLFFCHNQINGFHASRLVTFIYFLFETAFLSSYLFFDLPVIDTVGFLLPLAYSLFCFRDKWYICLFWTGILTLIIIGGTTVFSSICAYLWQLPTEALLNPTMHRLAYVIGLNVFLLICILLVIRISKRPTPPARSAFLLLITLNSVILFAIELVFSIANNIVETQIYTMICCSLFACAGLSIMLYEFMKKEAKKHQQYEARLNHISLKQQHFEEEKNLYSAIQILCHDLKHHMQLITELAESSQNAAAIAHVEMLQQETRAFFRPTTGNIAVDAILLAKENNMLAHNVQLHIQPYPLHELPINEMDFCIMLGNVLDNALEGVLRISCLTSATIELKFARSWDMFHISCSNPCNTAQVHLLNERFRSSKSPDRRGLGLLSVENIVSQADGQLSFHVIDDQFKIDILIPLQRNA